MIKFSVKLYLSLLLVLAASPVYSIRCFNTTVRTFVRCQEECTLFSDFMKLQTLIDTCNRKVRFGCELQPCSSNMGFQCMQNPDHPFPLCANDETIFDETDVDNVVPAKFLIDVNAPPLKIQYYFLVDTSSSMAPHLNMVKWKIKELIEMYKTMPQIEAKFALGEYRDPFHSGTPRSIAKGMCGLRRIRGFTNDIHMIQGDLDGLSAASDDHTGPEGLLPSLAQIAHFEPGWDNQARKIVIVIGDAPGYEQTKHDLPRPIPFPLGREHVVNLLEKKKIVLIGVNIGAPGLDGPTESHRISPPSPIGNTKQLSFIAKETGGVVTSPAKTLMTAVIDAKESYVREYTMDATDCQSKGVVMNDGKPFKVLLKPSESSTVDMTMIVRQKDGFCDPFECHVNFKEDGIDLVPMGMKFLKLNGCVPATA